jgi:thiol-disulfide isomerase/thioredoxin
MGFLENRVQMLGESVSNLGTGWDLKSTLFIIILIAAFLAAGYFVYINYVKPMMEPTFVNNNEFQSQESKARAEAAGAAVTQVGNKHADFYLFYTDWCPYSKKVKPIWDKIKAKFPSNVNETDYVINFIEINGESQAKELEEFQSNFLKDASKDKIDGYPSMYMVKDDQVIEFEAQPTEDTLTEFINAVF